VPPRERSVEEALDHLQHDYPGSNFARTGLKKVCPRCKRQGHVFLEVNRASGPRFAICWDGPSALAKDAQAIESGFANPNAVADFDLGVTIEELLGPTFGCGYDAPKAV
jgi:hypothetical protein